MLPVIMAPMGHNIDLVRYRNDGDDFHVIWAARRVLRMLDGNSGLVAVAVEGVSEGENRSGTPINDGLLVIDLAEYYGSEDLIQATQVVYSQLKYSTTAPARPWTVTGLKHTLKEFARRFLRIRAELGLEVATKVRFRFVSNRPISVPVQNVFTAAIAGTPLKKLDKRTKKTRAALLRATGLRVADFASFAAQVDLWGNQGSHNEQVLALAAEPNRYICALDVEAAKRMKDLVRSKTLSATANDKTINIDVLVQQFGLGSAHELLSCPTQFEKLDNPIPRAQEHRIVQNILESRWPVVICAPGGVGKTVFVQRLPQHLPPGSEAVIFDGFAGGDYRNPRLYRHQHFHGIVHIANELANRGLCDILLPQPSAPPQRYLIALRNRLEQAAAAVRARSREAVVLIAIDAADNLGIAAEVAQERSFVPDLLQEALPAGVCLVALARPHRVDRYLKPSNQVVRVQLDSFTLEESSLHLFNKFPSASVEDVDTFHRYTDCNPRVQANALAMADDLGALRDSLGPAIQTVDSLITSQLEAALSKVQHEQAVHGNEFNPLCTSLAALSPVPLNVLAEASGMTEEAVRSFISDFANGRTVFIRDGYAQFRDEPSETWFRERFMNTPAQAGQIADRLVPLAISNTYAASRLPSLLYHARRYNELTQLALSGTPPETADVVEKRNIILYRAQFALKAAIGQGNHGDIVKLMLRAGEEAAATDRQSGFLIDHADLVALLAGHEVVNDFVFKERPWRYDEKGYAYCAIMLAGDRRNHMEASRFLSMALAWLNQWFNEEDSYGDGPRPERIQINIDDIAVYAETVMTLHGYQALMTFMDNWRAWAAFDATRILVTHLIDRGDVHKVEELLEAAGDRLSVRLAAMLEMNQICALPPIKQVKITIALLEADGTTGDLTDHPGTDSMIGAALVATFEMAACVGIAKARIRALLDRYTLSYEHPIGSHDWEAKGDPFLRAAALKVALMRRALVLEDITPTSVRDKNVKPRSNRDTELQKFKDIYGPFLAWYSVRALALTGSVDSLDDLLADAKKVRLDIWSMSARYDYSHVPNNIAIIWLQALAWAGRVNDSSLKDIEGWMSNQQVMIFVSTWIRLARLAARLTMCHDAALNFARHARDLLESEHGEAKQTADFFVMIARAVMPLDKVEAAGYFYKGLEQLSGLGDELHDRLISILSIGRAASRTGFADPREAYRLARIGELFQTYKGDNRFPWGDVIDPVSKLCPASGLAIAARWHDRDKVHLSVTLPIVVLQLLKDGELRPTVVAALHAFGGNWSLREHAAILFERTPEQELKQAMLNMLALDYEFDEDRSEDYLKVLISSATANGLVHERLRALSDYKEVVSSIHNSQSPITASAQQKTATDSPVILQEIDPYTSQGVDEAISRWREKSYRSRLSDLMQAMRKVVEPARRVEHVFAWAGSQTQSVDMILDSLEACGNDWRDSLSVEQAIVQASKTLIRERASELADRAWDYERLTGRCAHLSGLTSSEVLKLMMQGLVDQVEHVSAASMFNLAAVLANTVLSPEEARQALTFALDRLEPILKGSDGDGPWLSALAPPAEVHLAVAHLLYAMLASPKTELRWRAAHAVRRICRFGEQEIIAELVRLLPCESLPTFTDVDLPFYAMHARLYLLIALDRAAEESPASLVPHARDLLKSAFAEPPHVLIQHFAARAALALEHARPGLFDKATIERLAKVNVSPFPPVSRDYDVATSWSHESEKNYDQFQLDYDFDRYWLEPLARCFNQPHAQVSDTVKQWVAGRWGKTRMSALEEDTRSRRGIYEGQETYATHGAYPNTDRYTFYLSYHAMFCAAGELLALHATTREYGQSDWLSWLLDHTLTRPDGKWLADRRDVSPLEVHTWQLDTNDVPSREEWPFSVRPEDFDKALGIWAENPEHLITSGWWYTRDSSRKETVRVSSGLVTPGTSIALLRALQTASNPHDYGIPDEQDRLEICLPGFELRGWITDPDRDLRLDKFDPFSGRIRWPGPRPGKIARRLLGLKSDSEGRIWHWNNRPAMQLQIWGDRREDRHRTAGNHGQRLTASIDFLLDVLKHLDMDLIIEVEVERRHDYQEEPEIDYAFRQYTRIYVLRGNGELHTLYGYRQLRP